MDLVFKRYPSPFLLVDSMIQMNQFNEWIDTVLGKHQDEILWDLYLHKCFTELSFDEFKNQCLNGADSDEFETREEFETTIKNSYEIMENFVPEGGI